MSFYSKKLRSVSDIAKEKQLLSDKLAEMRKEPMVSLPGFPGKGKSEKKSGADSKNEHNSWKDALSPSGPLFTLLTTLVTNRLFPKKREKVVYVAAGEKKPNFFIRFLLDVLKGYLLFKGLQLSIKGAKHLAAERKRKKEEEVDVKVSVATGSNPGKRK